MTAADALNAAIEKFVPRNVASYQRSDLLIRLNAGSRLSPDETRKVLSGEYSADPQIVSAIAQWKYLRGNRDRKAADKGEAFIRQYLPHALSLRDGLEALHEALDRGDRVSRVRMDFSRWIDRTADARKALALGDRRSLAACQGAFNRRLRKYERISLQRAGVCP
jgi:hypothetical protein